MHDAAADIGWLVGHVDVLWHNVWMDQSAAVHKDWPKPIPYCARWWSETPMNWWTLGSNPHKLGKFRRKRHTGITDLLVHARTLNTATGRYPCAVISRCISNAQILPSLFCLVGVIITARLHTTPSWGRCPKRQGTPHSTLLILPAGQHLIAAHS